MPKSKILNHRLSIGNQLFRLLWTCFWFILIRPLPRSYLNTWKVFIYKIFGADIRKGAIIYSSAKIYNPQKLIMEEGSVIGDQVDCYNVDIVHLGKNAIVSQKVYLCTASHNIYDGTFNLITTGIYIGDNAWIAADAFVAMGVNIGHDAVVGARSSVFKNVPPNTIVGGNPAKFIRNRF